MTDSEAFEHEVDLEAELEHDAAGDLEPGEPEPELEVEQPEPATMPAFNFNDRLFALGYSTSGKSEILNLIFSGLACQRLLIDNKPEFRIEDVTPAHAPEDVDWSEPIIHYQPAPGTDCAQYEELFAAAFQQRSGLTVCVHELGALVDYNANRAGRWLISYLSQGARLGLGALVGTQRPVYIPVAAQTEAVHVLVMTPQLARREDNELAAQALSPVDGEPLTTADMLDELAQLEHQHGEYSFLWKDRRGRQLVAFPPLPEALRSRSIVQRLEEPGGPGE